LRPDDRPYLLHAQLLRERVPSFDGYPFSLPVIHKLDILSFHPRVTFIVGENGSGKSTLLEGIAVAWGFNPEGGTRNFRFGTRASHSPLHQYLRLARSPRRCRDGYFLRAESFFNVATEIERLDEGPGGPPIIGSYGGRSLHEQSHGESFLALMRHRFNGRGFYILDEPEAALSPTRQLAVLRRLHELTREGAQFVIATHSPILMAYPDARILEIDHGTLREVTYTETEHYRVARRFLGDHQTALRELLVEDH
jgi:predicted ATPase